MKASKEMSMSVLLVSCLILHILSLVPDKPVSAFAAASSSDGSTARDVTSSVEFIGQPFSKSVYARNVWDMQTFDGKIYMGHGNSSNTGPASNGGPVPVHYYDPHGGKFMTQDVVSTNLAVKQYVDEEQIDIFKVLGGKLYIPGHDPRGDSWSYGNFYRLDQGQWTKYRNIPNAIHVYDMAYYQGYLFAGTSTKAADVFISRDMGSNWTKLGTVSAFGPYRVYTMFEFKNKLYAVCAMLPLNNKWSDENKIMSIRGYKENGADKFEMKQITVYGSKMFPGPKVNVGSYNPPYMRMVRTTVVNDRILYIGGEIYNDHQWLPKALFAAKDINDARRVALPNPNALPMDIVVRGDQIYVLAYVKLSSGRYANIVYQINVSDLDRDVMWKELFRFQHETFARSFEELDGDFYFGLGTDMENVSEAAGTILRVQQASYREEASARSIAGGQLADQAEEPDTLWGLMKQLFSKLFQ